MPARLTAVPFTKEDLTAVADFHCGDQPWAQYVTNWIRGAPGGVVEALEAGTELWLYLNDQNDIVGFGSLGTTEWLYPDAYGRYGSKKVVLNVIPAYATHTSFQGMPAGDWRQRYSSEILSDLINEAIQRCRRDHTLEPLLGLFVDERNQRAIDHYLRHGFTTFGKPIKGRGQRMLLNLPVSAAEAPESTETQTQHEQTTSGQAAVLSDSAPERTFEEAVDAAVNAPQLPEQQAKKAARKARVEARRKRADANWGARKVRKNPKHGRR